MKKSVRTQAAFFNLRLVLALFLCCSGGAFLAFGQPGQPSNSNARNASAIRPTKPVPGLAEVIPIEAAVGHNKDLRDLPYIPNEGEHEEKRLLRHPLPMTPAKFDPIVKNLKTTSAPTMNMPSILTQFDGLNLAQSACSCSPPDTEGDVGPNHYIESVNSSIKIFDKSGNPLNGTNGTTYNSFFSPLGSSTPCGNGLNDGDGYVFYDHIANRWVVSDFAFPSNNSVNYQCIGVSKTADPVSGGWWLYALQIDASNPT